MLRFKSHFLAKISATSADICKISLKISNSTGFCCKWTLFGVIELKIILRGMYDMIVTAVLLIHPLKKVY